jgi:hypothetical protein
MQTWIDIRVIAFAVLAVCTFYKTIYKWIGFFVKAKKFDPVEPTKKYGIVIYYNVAEVSAWTESERSARKPTTVF